MVSRRVVGRARIGEGQSAIGRRQLGVAGSGWQKSSPLTGSHRRRPVSILRYRRDHRWQRKPLRMATGLRVTAPPTALCAVPPARRSGWEGAPTEPPMPNPMPNALPSSGTSLSSARASHRRRPLCRCRHRWTRRPLGIDAACAGTTQGFSVDAGVERTHARVRGDHSIGAISRRSPTRGRCRSGRRGTKKGLHRSGALKK